MAVAFPDDECSSCDWGHFSTKVKGLARKRPFFLLAVFFILFPGSLVIEAGVRVKVLRGNPARTRICYEFDEFFQRRVSIDGENYTLVSLQGESNRKTVGAPALPAVSRSIIIPDNARMVLRVLDSSYYDIKDIDIVPSKGYISRKINPADVPYTFGDSYRQSTFYPGSLAQLGEPYIMRDHRGVVVRVNPFQYNPVRRVLRVYTDMTLEVKTAGLGRFNVLKRRPDRHSRAFRQLYSTHFLNYETESRYSALDEEGEMLIIVHDAWNSNVQPLKTHKESMGINTTVVNVSTIGNDATSIKNYIQSVYDSNDLAFVLLVGDAEEVATDTALGGASDPSYSKLAGNDYYPEIIVGRLSARTAAQVNTQVERIIDYETMPAFEQSWFWKGVGIASDDGTGDGDDSEWDWEHIRNIRTDLLNYGYTSIDELYDGNCGGEDEWGDPTPSMLSNSLNAGRGIINYCGHGSATGWGTTDFSNSDVNALANVDMLPFIFDSACNNGEFDNYDTCFAESWMRATDSNEPTGAVGIYASSISQPWAPPMEAQDEFNLLYTDYMNRPYYYFGTHCYAGACSMMDDYPGGGGVWGTGPATFNTWHIFGDPSLCIVDPDVNSPPFAFDSSVSTDVNTPVTITLGGADEGLPDPPGALTYIIVSLPSHGDLNEPGVGLIGDPCTALQNYGNQVEYIPDRGYDGLDEFDFKVNDGGTEPNGGDSEIATVIIDVLSEPERVYYADFESGLAGWTIDNNFGNGGGLWHLATGCESTSVGHTVPTSLYYGLDGSCDYDAGLTEGVVTSPSISLAMVEAPIELSFNYFLETEALAPEFDVVTVEISQDGGSFTEVSGNSDESLSDPSGGWISKTIDLSALAGSDIEIRFTFDTIDSWYNNHPGFYVDDVNVTGIYGDPDCPLPAEPNYPSPSNGANTVELDTILEWNIGRDVSDGRGEQSFEFVVSDDILAQIEDDEPNPLPRYATSEERLILEGEREIGVREPLDDRQRAAPSGYIWTPGEYEKLDGVLFRWGAFNSVLTELIVGVSDPANESTAYVIVTGSSQQSSCSSTLELAGADMDNVEFITYTTDSVWICDYGPRYFYEDYELVMMDHNYNRPRPDDDAFPSWLSYYWGQKAYELEELSLEHGGGNFHALSDGNAFMSTQVLDDNPGYEESDVVQVFEDYHNVDLTIYEKLPSGVDSTGHIDMWLLPLSDEDILISEFAEGAPGDDVTDTAAADLESRGYTVWRTPAWVSDSNHYTYTNAAVVNDKVFIPAYGDANDAVALSVYQQAMPGRDIVQVDCNSVISYGGAIHCITKPVYSSELIMWDVYFGTEPENLELICEDTRDPLCAPGLLDSCMPYYWQVVAKNCCGQTEGDVWSFTTCIRGDFHLDGDVDAADLELLADQWLTAGGSPSADIAPVPSGDGIVDFFDFAEFAIHWLEVCE